MSAAFGSLASRVALVTGDSRGIGQATAPGFIETDMTRDLHESVGEGVRKRIPLGRLGAVEDVAQTVHFLVSEEAAYITGQIVRVNGGLD
jgi:3-oxoacyl-[acyl-carrier protein] reductase